MVIKPYSIWLIDLNPTKGHKISKMWPCVVVSPESINNTLKTVLVAPLTSTIRSFPFRVHSSLEGKGGQVALDQIRCVDKVRLLKNLGQLTESEARQVAEVLVEMFVWE